MSNFRSCALTNRNSFMCTTATCPNGAYAIIYFRRKLSPVLCLFPSHVTLGDSGFKWQVIFNVYSLVILTIFQLSFFVLNMCFFCVVSSSSTIMRPLEFPFPFFLEKNFTFISGITSTSLNKDCTLLKVIC